MTVRAATVSDAAAIAALEAAVFPDAWGEQTIADTLRSERTHAFVALDGASVTGFVLAQSIPPEAELLRIATHPSYRRRGVGQALVGTLLTELRGVGVPTVFLEVRSHNAPARALYERNGFAPIGLRRAYYHHPTDDAVLMCHMDEDSAPQHI